MRAQDILGQNARNLLYIKKYNSKKAISFADSKYKTKRFLEVRNIPAPRVYATIQNKKDLLQFHWNALPSSFVIKPNAGSGGEGIIVIKEKVREGVFRKITGEEITVQQMKDHVRDILDGGFSLGNISDFALFEQRIINHPQLEELTSFGLCDIRILVFNLVPVMAMLRIPTAQSDGKANVHMGGIGAGIDIARGTITHLTQYNRIIKSIPGIGEVRGRKIPFWDELLFTASRIQQLTGLGYLAVDLALDASRGPVLLEINARAGLMLQVANLAPLRKRLERIKGIKVKSPEKGVRLAQDLFGRGVDRTIRAVSGKEVIGLSEYVEIIGKQGVERVLAKIDLSLEKSQIARPLYNRILLGLSPALQENGYVKRRLQLLGKKIVTLLYPVDLPEDGPQVILAKRDLKEFLVDPYKYKKGELSRLAQAEVELGEQRPVTPLPKKTVAERAQELFAAARPVTILKYLKPVNYAEELKTFVKKEGQYNPQFVYPALAFDPTLVRSQVESIHFPDTPEGLLLEGKRTRILQELDLLEVVGKDVKSFTQASEVLYGFSEEYFLNLAEEKVRDRAQHILQEHAPLLTADEVKKQVEDRLITLGLTEWKVELVTQLASRMAVSRARRTIKVLMGATFTERSLVAALLHELETHVFRAVNGLRQPVELLGLGTADYLETEEGMAVYNQEAFLTAQDEKYYHAPLSYIKVHHSLSLSFAETAEYLRRERGITDLERLFTLVFRVKRGLGDTSIPGGFTRDMIYFRGYVRVAEYLAHGGSLEALYLGKFGLKEMELVMALPDLLPPHLLPSTL